MFDPLTAQPVPGPLGSFWAFAPAGWGGGVFVSSDGLAGDVDADGTLDLAVGSGPGVPGRVRVFSGKTGAVLRDFAPFGSAAAGGVRTALAYVDDDPFADIVTGTGPGVPARVRVFSGKTGDQLPAPQGEYTPFGPLALGGVFVAASNDPHLTGSIYGDFSATIGLPTGVLPFGDLLELNGNTDPAQYTVTIDWGDSTTSSGWVECTGYDGMGQVTYDVMGGPHTYADPSDEMTPYTVTVTVESMDGDSVTGCVSAQVGTPAGLMVIHNGLDGATGGQAIVGDRLTKGAVTVANRNNTNGDLLNGAERIDRDQTTVTANGVLGRDEVDLMKLVFSAPVDRANPTKRLNAGLVRVRVESGNGIQLWTTRTKNADTLAPATLNVATAFANQTPDVTWWVEATAPSTTIRDISLVYEYQAPGSTKWVKMDNVKATAIWVTMSRSWMTRTTTPVPGDQTLPDLTNDGLKVRIAQGVAVDGTRYGFGPSSVVQGADTLIGGRMLMEFTVQPAGDLAALGVRFDVTRQVQENAYTILADGKGVLNPAADHTRQFPYNANQNNELPNDDKVASDEQNTPGNSHLYSWDAPGVRRDLATVAGAWNWQYSIQRDWFQEWVRVRLDGNNFSNQGVGTTQAVEGSRASDRVAWHYTGYFRRDTNANLVNDIDALSGGIPVLQQNALGNGTAVAPPLGGDTEGYSMLYTVANGMGSWAIRRFTNGQVVQNDFATSGVQPVGSPAGTTWTVTIPGKVSVVITQGANAFANNDQFWFVDFKSQSPGGKVNEIALGNYSAVTGDATDVP